MNRRQIVVKVFQLLVNNLHGSTCCARDAEETGNYRSAVDLQSSGDPRLIKGSTYERGVRGAAVFSKR